MNSDAVILSSAIVTVGSTVAASMLPKEYGGEGEFPSARLLVGSALTFAGLSMLGEFAPNLAAPLSVAIAMTALTYYGVPVADKWFAETPKGK